MVKIIIPFILYFFCISSLKKIIPFLKKNSILDHPSSRGNHEKSMPKGAGIILIPAIIISVSLYFFIENSINTKWLVFLLSIFFLFLISLIDDIKSLLREKQSKINTMEELSIKSRKKLELINKNFAHYNTLILFLGKTGKDIINECLKLWKFDYEIVKSLTDANSVIVKISNLEKI